jgi:23S rRNA (guanosine2251-2'-O)-methyltransferase
MKENEMIFGIRAVIEAILAEKEIDKILSKKRFTKRSIQRTV